MDPALVNPSKSFKQRLNPMNAKQSHPFGVEWAVCAHLGTKHPALTASENQHALDAKCAKNPP